MKNKILMRVKFIYVLIAMFFISCTSRQTEDILNDVESYIKERPDSALTVLDSIDRDLLTTRRLRSHHALLYAAALDKNFIDVADDSLALTALDWYDRHGNKKYKARSLFYLGISYYNSRDYVRAILELTRAEEIAQTCDSLYWGLIKGTQAHIYSKAYNNEEELNCAQKAYDIYKGLSEKYYIDISRYRLAHIYMNQGKYDKAEPLLYEIMNDESVNNHAKGNASCSFAYLKVITQKCQPDEAINLYRNAIKMYGNEYMTIKDWWAYASLLAMTGERKQSQELIRQLEVIDTTSSSYYWKYFISKKEGDYMSALQNLEQSSKKESKYIVQALGQSLSLTQRDYYQAQSEIAQYKVKIRTLITLISVISSILLVVIISVVVSLRLRKYREEKENYIQYVEEMTRQLNEIHKEEVPSIKGRYLELYKQKFADLRVLCDTYLQFQGRNNAEKMMYSKVVSMVDALRVDMQDHSKLEEMLDEDLNGVMSSLRSEIKMKEIDYIVFGYLAMGFDATTISRLIDTSVNTVYIRKSRIKKHIEESNSSQKDTFLVIMS